MSAKNFSTTLEVETAFNYFAPGPMKEYERTVVVCYALLFVALGAWYLLRRSLRLDLDKIPVPTISETLDLLKDQARCFEWFRKTHEKYGPIFRVRILHREMVIIADPRVAAQVLNKGPNYVPRKASEYSGIDPVSHEVHSWERVARTVGAAGSIHSVTRLSN